MAQNQVYADIESLREVWTLAAETEAGTPVIQGTRPGVTYTGTPGLTRSITVGGITVSGIQVSNTSAGTKRATIATTGTWEFPVVGATGATAQGTKVYYDATAKGLTLTATSNTFYGVVNLPEGYVQHDTTLPVKIGVVA